MHSPSPIIVQIKIKPQIVSWVRWLLYGRWQGGNFQEVSTLLVRNLPSMMNIFKDSQHEISEATKLRLINFASQG